MLTLISSRKKPSGMCSVSNSKFKSLGSCGRSCSRTRLAVRWRLSRLGRLGQGASVNSFKRISLTTSDAGLKRSFEASFFTRQRCSVIMLVPSHFEHVLRSLYYSSLAAINSVLSKFHLQPHILRWGGFQLLRNFCLRTHVNFTCVGTEKKNWKCTLLTLV